MTTFIIGLVVLLIGGALYGRLCEKAFRPDSRETPAVRLNDGIDFVPMKKWKNALIELLNIAGTGGYSFRTHRLCNHTCGLRDRRRASRLHVRHDFRAQRRRADAFAHTEIFGQIRVPAVQRVRMSYDASRRHGFHIHSGRFVYNPDFGDG